MNRLNVLYEDNHIIVVVKPANILSQADDTKDLDMLTIIKAYLKEKYQKPGNVYLGLVHRLDRPVSGVMVFAKTSKAASRLSEQVRNHEFKKKYLAIIVGIMASKTGTLTDYLVKELDGTTKVTDENKGKLAVLNYSVKDVNKVKNMSLIDINLESGRHHQIRVQFASRGYPLYGDQRYGKQDKVPIALHAYQISFTHPVTRKNLTFKSLPYEKGVWEHFKIK